MIVNISMECGSEACPLTSYALRTKNSKKDNILESSFQVFQSTIFTIKLVIIATLFLGSQGMTAAQAVARSPSIPMCQLKDGSLGLCEQTLLLSAHTQPMQKIPTPCFRSELLLFS
jgi:hypothetical protein